MKKRSILIVAGNLKIGGAQKALVNFLNFLGAQYNIDLFLFRKVGEYLNQIYNNVRIDYIFPDKRTYNSRMKKKGTLLTRFKRKLYDYIFSPFSYNMRNQTWLHTQIYYKIFYFIKFRKAKYEHIIAFNHTREMLVVAFSPVNSKKTVIIHGDLKMHKSEFSHDLQKKAYENFDTIICVSEDSKRSFAELFPTLVDKVQVIPNFLDTKEIEVKSKVNQPNYNKNVFNIVIVGRFALAKGHKRLIEVHHKLIDDGYFHHLHFIGDGSLMNEVKKYCNENFLTETVKFWGGQTNPYPFIKSADMVLLPSIYEALPTVLFEALLLNKPILATDVGGVREILEDGKYGEICENSEEGLYEALKNSVSEFLKFGKIKLKYSSYDYPNHEIMNQYRLVFGDKALSKADFNKTIQRLEMKHYGKPYFSLDYMTVEDNNLIVKGIFFVPGIELSEKGVYSSYLEFDNNGSTRLIQLENEMRWDVTLLHGNLGEFNYNYSGFYGSINLDTFDSGRYNIFFIAKSNGYSFKIRLKATKNCILSNSDFIQKNSRSNLSLIIQENVVNEYIC